MHFAGGFWISGMTLWVWMYSGFIKPKEVTRLKMFVVSFLSIVCVGVSWEIFEAIADTTLISSSGYVSDSLLDLFADLTGAMAAAWYVASRRRAED